MFNRPHLCILIVSLFFEVQAAARVLLEDYDFQIVERVYEEDDKSFTYSMQNIHGNERENNSLNRLSIISEDQFDYPFPESGCGPTAILNILVWYEKFGLVRPFDRAADGRISKINLFEHIDKRFTQVSGMSRQDMNGTGIMDAALVLDKLVQDGSDGKVRVHADYIGAPLELNNFLSVMPNFRAGYLVARPRSLETGKLQQLHAVTIIRADRSGYLTLATWGEVYRGLIRKRIDGQWFVPSDPEHAEMKIVGLLRFIPFEPAVAEVSDH